ncbi:DUF6879 family protein [Nocardia asteroides]|uniref:DUF6879 family protein n=1 Tax=Nocardia asteroides TaxID=1824 RepID=UPI00342C30C6
MLLRLNDEPDLWGSLFAECKRAAFHLETLDPYAVASESESEPLSDYQRWLLTLTPENIAAGEDIRYLPRHLAGRVPTEDYRLFDDERVAFHARDADNRGLAMVVSDDPGLVEYAIDHRNRLWELATPFTEYTGS